jgi:putative aldouronate transport system substrate-binding protein
MKKRVALLLAAVLVLSVFSACGSSTTTAETTTTTSSETTAAETTTAAEAETTTSEAAPAASEEAAAPAETEEAAPAEEEEVDDSWEYTPISYPLVTTPVTMDYWMIWELSSDTIYNDISEHVVLKELAEATGIQLNLLAQSQASGQTTTNLMIVSGDYPDFIGDLSYSTGMDAAIDDEVVVNIKDMIAEYSPDYYKYLIADDNKLWKAVQTDEGNIGAYITVGTVPEVGDGTMTYQFMLDELGYTQETLRTIDQYEEYLTAAKTAYGMASPLYLPGDFMLDGDTIANAFGVALKIDAITGELPWTVVDGEVQCGYLEEGFTEYVTLMHDWYEKGLIDTDTASHPTEYKNEDLIGLIAGKQVSVFHRGDGLVDLFIALSGEDIVPLYFPTVTEGETLHIGGAADSVSGESGTVITTGCEDVELAMQFMNYLYTDEYYLPSNYGVEGETFDIDSNGDPQFQDWTWQTAGRTFSSVMMDYTLFTMVDANVVTPGQSEAAAACADVWNSNLDNVEDYPDAAAMNLDESDAYSRHSGDIVTLAQEYTAKFITGDLPLSDIPAFQEKLITSGVNDCIAAKQSAYDRYMSRE